MKTIAFRVKPGDDLREEIEKKAREHDVSAGTIVTCVGSLNQLHIRLADENKVLQLEGLFEIVSLVGTLSPDGVHLHISVGDEKGAMFGGHLKHESIVRTTAEVVIGMLPDTIFSRTFDPETGFEELNIN